MAESELSINYADLMSKVGAYLGYGRISSAWTAEQRAEIDDYVQSGVRRFYYPPAVQGAEEGYPWSFLSPVASLTTVIDQETYDLPGDLGRILGQLHFATDEHRCAIVQVTEDRYLAFKSSAVSGGAPRFVCVRHKPKEPGRGQRLEASFWPAPDAVYVLSFRYEAFNGKLSDDNPYPLGGMRHGELIVESCLAVAELRANDERNGPHSQEFERLLVSAIKQDRRVGATNFGRMGDSSDMAEQPRRIGGYPVTYNGEVL